MTQSYPGPNPRLDRGTANPDGDLERTDGRTELAQNIWDRYGYSPGVIPTGATLELARRVTRLTAERLPLLVDIQRRWGGTEASFSHGWSALPYAWPIGFAGSLSMSANTAPPATATGVRNLAYAGPAPLSADLARSQRVVSALPAKEQGSPDRWATEKPLDRTIGPRLFEAERGAVHRLSGGKVQRSTGAKNSMSIVSQGEDRLQSETATGPGEHAVKGGTKSCPVTSGDDLGAVILQRFTDGPAGRAMQRIPGMPESVCLEGSGTFDVRQQADGPAAGSEGVLETVTMAGRQDHSGEPKNSTDTVTGRNVGPSTSLTKDAPRMQPLVGKSRHWSDTQNAQAEMPTKDNPDNLGAGIVQRLMDGPAGRVMERMPGMPEPGRLEGCGIFDVLSRAEGPVALSKAVSGTDPMAGVEYSPAGAQDSMPTVADRKISPSSPSGKEAPMRQPVSEAQAADDATSKSSSLEAIIRQKEEPSESVVAEISTKASRAVKSSQSMILGKRIGKRIRDGTNPETSEKLGRMDGGFPPDTMVRVQPRHSASATGSTRRSELNQPLVSVVNAYMILRKSSTRQSYEPQGKPMVSPMGLVTAQPAALVVQPQQEGVETKNWQSTEKATGAADRSQASVTVQIPAGLTRLPKPDMVWRKSTIESSASNLFSAGTSAGAKTSLPLTINSAGGGVLSMARQTTTAASPAVEPGTSEGCESPIPIREKGPEQSNEMDLQQLAEQVSRLIFRKLVVERERRGIGRWH